MHEIKNPKNDGIIKKKMNWQINWSTTTWVTDWTGATTLVAALVMEVILRIGEDVRRLGGRRWRRWGKEEEEKEEGGKNVVDEKIDWAIDFYWLVFFLNGSAGIYY